MADLARISLAGAEAEAVRRWDLGGLGFRKRRDGLGEEDRRNCSDGGSAGVLGERNGQGCERDRYIY